MTFYNHCEGCGKRFRVVDRRVKYCSNICREQNRTITENQPVDELNQKENKEKAIKHLKKKYSWLIGVKG